MRGQLFNAAITTLVISCLLITFADHPKELTALIAYAGLILALLLGIAGIFAKPKPATPLRLSEEEAQALRQKFRESGEIAAIKQLREAHPQLSLIDAQSMVKTIIY